MHVSLTPRLEKLIRDKVEAGLYNNASEVVREALRLMEKRDERHRLQLESIRNTDPVSAVLPRGVGLDGGDEDEIARLFRDF